MRLSPPPPATINGCHGRPDSESGLLEEVPPGGAQWPLPSAPLTATAVGGLRITTERTQRSKLGDTAFIDAVKVPRVCAGEGGDRTR